MRTPRRVYARMMRCWPVLLLLLASRCAAVPMPPMPKLDEFVVAVHADESPPERLAAAQLAHWLSAALPRPTPLFVLPANASAAGKRPRFAVGAALARARCPR